MPSPELAAPPAVSAASGARLVTRALAWQVPVVELDPATALRCSGDVPEGSVAGPVWRHLREVAAFADDLAARGRALPVVLPPPGRSAASPLGLRPWGGRAVWRPLPTGADAAWARALVLALPPAGLGAPRPGGARPADVVGAALDDLLDAAVRRRLAASGRRRDRRDPVAGVRTAPGRPPG